MTSDLKETDRKYIKFKMKRVKKAKKRGNNAEAERHATELIQYLGLEEGSEAPIEQNTSSNQRLQSLRKG